MILDEQSFVIDRGAIHLPPELLTMHYESGLLRDIGARGKGPIDTATDIERFLGTWFRRPTPITVGGSGVDRFDIPFLRADEHLDQLPERFDYGTLDTSGIKRISRLAGREIHAGRNGGAHRAVADATDSFLMAQRFASLLERGVSA